MYSADGNRNTNNKKDIADNPVNDPVNVEDFNPVTECLYDIPAFTGLPTKEIFIPGEDAYDNTLKPVRIVNVRKYTGWKLEVMADWTNGARQWGAIHGVLIELNIDAERFMQAYGLTFHNCGYVSDPRKKKGTQRHEDDFAKNKRLKRDSVDYKKLTNDIHSKLRLNMDDIIDKATKVINLTPQSPQKPSSNVNNDHDIDTITDDDGKQDATVDNDDNNDHDINTTNDDFGNHDATVSNDDNNGHDINTTNDDNVNHDASVDTTNDDNGNHDATVNIIPNNVVINDDIDVEDGDDEVSLDRLGEEFDQGAALAEDEVIAHEEYEQRLTELAEQTYDNRLDVLNALMHDNLHTLSNIAEADAIAIGIRSPPVASPVVKPIYRAPASRDINEIYASVTRTNRQVGTLVDAIVFPTQTDGVHASLPEVSGVPF
jgi:hypothetical protein